MNRRPLGRKGPLLPACGVGTTRFPSRDLQDEAGWERCARLLAYAVKQGCCCVDNAFSYADGHSGEICARLLRLVPREEFFLSVKSNAQSDPTAESVLRRVESGLEQIGTEYFDFLYMWSILDGEQYRAVMAPGGPYQGALEALRRGWVRHLLFSSHAPPQTTMEILRDNVFEGVLLSYNLLNFRQMDPVLECAQEQGQGVLVMNPLGGGMIPQNEELFSAARLPGDGSAAEAALRFVYAHPQVCCVLAGVSRREDVDQALRALGGPPEGEARARERIRAAAGAVGQVSGLCTGCGYCLPACPRQLPIPALMQSYNMKLLRQKPELYRRTDPALLERIAVLQKLVQGFQCLPETAANPCIACGRCCKVCTQRLPIPERMAELAGMVQAAGASSQAHRERLDQLLNGRGYRRVAMWPAAGYTAFVFREYLRFFGEPPFQVVFLDSSPAAQGGSLMGCPVLPPSAIEQDPPDCLLITSYRYQEELLQAARPYRALGVPVLCLHRPGDVPWVF